VVDTAGEKSPPDELWISPRPWCGGLPRHPVGWLLLAVGLSVTGSGLADGDARYRLVARPGALPAARRVAIYSPATTLVGLALVGFVLLLTVLPGGGYALVVLGLGQLVGWDPLRAELVAVVGQTMQPTSVSLWLRPSRSPEVPASTGTG
jgi:hypothetical protein